MKSHITIIIDKDTEDIMGRLTKTLAKHQLDEDSPESIQKHHWDYWYFPNNTFFYDNEFREKFLELNSELLRHTTYIKNLPEDYSTSGIIDLNGKWIDLQDFNWKMIDEGSPNNKTALEKWNEEYKRILDENKNHICVQVMVHS